MTENRVTELPNGVSPVSGKNMLVKNQNSRTSPSCGIKS